MHKFNKNVIFATGHASHEACELKCELPVTLLLLYNGHASHEACELK